MSNYVRLLLCTIKIITYFKTNFNIQFPAAVVDNHIYSMYFRKWIIYINLYIDDCKASIILNVMNKYIRCLGRLLKRFYIEWNNKREHLVIKATKRVIHSRPERKIHGRDEINLRNFTYYMYSKKALSCRFVLSFVNHNKKHYFSIWHAIFRVGPIFRVDRGRGNI